MSQSSRARAYLATLRRFDPVPVDEVSEALKRAACPVFDVWLDFHTRFAGYEEIIGRETAIWGIVHRAPLWLDPGEASCTSKGSTWRVRCADVHPSYDYWLDSKGEFVTLGGGEPCETFDVKVERLAMWWEATAHGRAFRLADDLLKIAGSVDALQRALDLAIDREASDKYTTCWRGDDAIVVVRETSTRLWVAVDARERVRSRVTRGAAD